MILAMTGASLAAETAGNKGAPSADSTQATEKSPIEFNAGADLRVRQEIMDNVPGLPGGGLLQRAERGPYRNHMRYRVRAWGELKAAEKWRVYMRVTDEFRWNIRPRNHKTTFPDELILDNLYIDATDLFDGLMDFRVGRQDIYGLYGLDHIFVDGTPGDGSRTVYSDVARATFHFEEDEKLDVFFLHNSDDNRLRWGTHRGDHRSMSGLGGGAEVDMDDWGWGAVWSGKAAEWLPYQVFAMQKITDKFSRRGVHHPYTRRELVGAKLMPRLNEEFSLQLEAMGQVGRDGDGDWLSGWSGYAGVNWKQQTLSDIKPFASLGAHFMSGDKHAADENGGHHAWDPMWSRGVNDSEIFLYGTHYGVAWWSNMMFLNLKGGVEFGPHHRISAATGPMFAAVDDGLGGDDGNFKGYLSLVRYDFPILLADKKAGERFEIFGHVHAELFNPGDYFATDRPSWFLRWQVELAF